MKQSKFYKELFPLCMDEYVWRNVQLKLFTYEYGEGLAVGVCYEDHGDMELVSINLPIPFDDDTLACIDTNNASWIGSFLKKNKLAKPTGKYVYSGWCRYPVYKFNLEKFTEEE